MTEFVIRPYLNVVALSAFSTSYIELNLSKSLLYLCTILSCGICRLVLLMLVKFHLKDIKYDRSKSVMIAVNFPISRY